MKKSILLTLVLIFGLTGIGSAQSGCPMRGGMGGGMGGMGGICQGMNQGGMDMPRGRWWLMPDVVEKHKITKEEQDQLDKLYNDNRRALVDMKSNLEKELLTLEEELNKKEFDEKKCVAAFKKVQEARTTLAMEGFKYIVEVRKILGQERFRQLQSSYKDFRKDRMQKGQGRKGPMGGMPPSTGAPM